MKYSVPPGSCNIAIATIHANSTNSCEISTTLQFCPNSAVVLQIEPIILAPKSSTNNSNVLFYYSLLFFPQVQKTSTFVGVTDINRCAFHFYFIILCLLFFTEFELGEVPQFNWKKGLKTLQHAS